MYAIPDNNFNGKIISSIILCVLMGLLYLFPVRYQWIKLFIIISLIILTISNSSNYYLSKKAFYWTISYIILGFFLIFHGILSGNPAPMSYFAVYVLWPFLYMLLSGCINFSNFKIFLKISKLCLVINIIIGLLAFFKFNLLIEPQGQFMFYKASIRPGFPFICIESPNIVDFFLVYFFLITLMFMRVKEMKIVDWLILLGGILYIFATSRRILFFCFAILFMILLFFIKYVPRNERRILLKSFKIIGFGLVLILLFTLMWLKSEGIFKLEDLGVFFKETGEASDGPRVLQREALLTGWMDSPVLGHGSGVDASVSRSDIPGTYELSYHAKLFEGGLFGFVWYIVQFIILFIWLIKVIIYDKQLRLYSIATVTMLTIFLVSNATNPYINAFDYIWFIYISFFIINIHDRKSRINHCQEISTEC